MLFFCGSAEDVSDLWLLKKRIVLSLSSFFFNAQMRCFILKAMGAVRPADRAGSYLGLFALLIDMFSSFLFWTLAVVSIPKAAHVAMWQMRNADFYYLQLRRSFTYTIYLV